MSLPLLPLALAGAALLLLTGRGGARAPGAGGDGASRRQWPVRPYRGVINGFKASREGGKRIHAGVDLGAAQGDEIVALDDGEILGLASGYAIGAGLQALRVRHPDADYIYAEIDALGKPGDVVKAGDVIGRARKNSAGNTMLHLEAWETGTAPVGFTPWWAGSAAPKGLLDVGEIVKELAPSEAAS